MAARKKLPLKIGNVPAGYEAKIIAELLRDKQRSILHIARNDRDAMHIRAALDFFAPDIHKIFFPAWDCAPYDRISPDRTILASRMAILSSLAAASAPAPHVLIASASAVSQRLPPRDMVFELSWHAKSGQNIDVDELQSFLERMGYSRSPVVYEEGDYAIRGGVLDIFAPGFGRPLRVDLFGDHIESIRYFDPATQRASDSTDIISLAPVSEYSTDQQTANLFRQQYREQFGSGRGDPLYEAISALQKFQGAEHWLPLFHENLETLFDYTSEDYTGGHLITHCQHLLGWVEERWSAATHSYSLRGESKEAGFHSAQGASVNHCPPEQLYIDAQQLESLLADRERRIFFDKAIPTGLHALCTDVQAGRDFLPERQRNDGKLFDHLVAHIEDMREGGRPVIIASATEGARERFSHLLSDHGISAARNIDNFPDVTPVTLGSSGEVLLVVWNLQRGFVTEDFAVISEQDVLGERLVRRYRKRRSDKSALIIAEELSVGDLVVHIEHGIGRYGGMVTIDLMGCPHECVLLHYHGGDKLYLPIENIDMISRYGEAGGAVIDRLGAGGWQTRKARLKSHIRDIAASLIKIAAERHLRSSQKFVPPEAIYDEFSARFAYEETEDQLTAIDDVLADLQAGTPMDRLVCGDVGFGKTEVAVRAAYVAAMGGSQVAVIVPTTLLARQHYATFSERFDGTGLRLRHLSRLTAAPEAKRTREEMSSGACDIVIGTHALLAKTARFKNLALLIIDEEQHFGVRHKERLKELKSDIHVLTLTATPIPRTLQLALTGIREFSLISTPPVDRIAIRTYVAPLDPAALREALLREHHRGGQSFFVVPKISHIAEVEQLLREIVPEIKFLVAHGRLPASQLEQRMLDFQDRKATILVTTNIIESGIDIATANTIIIHNADHFGLSQLYQLRGRVGRTNIRAYAYVTYNPKKPLTQAAEKRLRILHSLDALGAGFKLASHDLDIRGAGNIVGEAQSGHIREVGFELYRQMLEEAVASMRAEDGAVDIDQSRELSPSIKLGVPVLIPEDYITDLDVRLGLYRRLASLDNRQEFEGFAAELHDRFGEPPPEVETLLLVVRIKANCRRAGISRLEAGPKGATITFHENRFANPAGLAEWLSHPHSHAKLRLDNSIFVRRSWQKEKDRINGAIILARDLAKIASEKQAAAAN